MLTIESQTAWPQLRVNHHSCPQMTMSWPWDGVYEWKLVISCRGSLCELVFGLNLKPCPRFQEASQGWESFPHLSTVELYQARISMNQQRRRVDAVFVCLRLACMCTVAICVCASEERGCVCWAQQGACWESTVQGLSVLPVTKMWYTK